MGCLRGWSSKSILLMTWRKERPRQGVNMALRNIRHSAFQIGWLAMSCGIPAASFSESAVAADTPQVLIVLGAEGESTYGEQFRSWGERWQRAFGNDALILDGTGTDEKSEASENSDNNDRASILRWIEESKSRSTDADGTTTRWLVLIGHGTSDRSATKFNLRGPDIAAEDLSKALEQSPGRWVIVNCFSASGPLISTLSGQNRIVITATKSGAEQNYSRFGDYLSKAILDPASDLDHDSSISVLEAFLAASSGVAHFYSDEGRLASEQAILDDNGDRKGTPAVFFRGIRPIKAPADGLQLDGNLAKRILVHRLLEAKTQTPETQATIEMLEQEIETLRGKKKDFPESEYYEKLESLLLKLAHAIL